MVVDGGKIVNISSFITINDFSLLKFMNAFSYLPVPSRPNISTCFQHVDISQLTLQHLPLLLKPSA